MSALVVPSLAAISDMDRPASVLDPIAYATPYFSGQSGISSITAERIAIILRATSISSDG